MSAACATRDRHAFKVGDNALCHVRVDAKRSQTCAISGGDQNNARREVIDVAGTCHTVRLNNAAEQIVHHEQQDDRRSHSAKEHHYRVAQPSALGYDIEVASSASTVTITSGYDFLPNAPRQA